MVISAWSGPLLSYGVVPPSTVGTPLETNDQRGPSLADLGTYMMDPRPQYQYQPGAGQTSPEVYGLPGFGGGPVMDFIPPAISSNGVALSFSATGTAPFSVAATLSTAGGTLTKISGFLGATLTAPVTVYVIDSPRTAAVGFGLSGAINIWDPTTTFSRCLTVNGTSGSSNTNYVFRGFDIWGYQMTCTVQGTSAGAGNTVTTPKAFKYMLSLTANTTTTGGSSNVTAGTADAYGFPLAFSNPAYWSIWWGNSTGASPNAQLLQSISSATVAVTSASTYFATSTTGDVRGTISFSTTTQGGGSSVTGNRLQMFWRPSVQFLQGLSLPSGANNFVPLVGMPQA